MTWCPLRGQKVVDEFHDIVGEGVCVQVRGTAKCPHCHRVGPRGAAQAKVDPARVQRLKRAKLLSHDKGSVVWQHHTAGSDPERAGGIGQVRDEDGGR